MFRFLIERQFRLKIGRQFLFKLIIGCQIVFFFHFQIIFLGSCTHVGRHIFGRHFNVWRAKFYLNFKLIFLLLGNWVAIFNLFSFQTNNSSSRASLWAPYCFFGRIQLKVIFSLIFSPLSLRRLRIRCPFLIFNQKILLLVPHVGRHIDFCWKNTIGHNF